MRTLTLRLAVNVAAAALIALLVADVIFMFWVKATRDRERHLQLVAAAHELAWGLTGADDPLLSMENIAGRYGVTLRVLGGHEPASAGAPPAPEFGASDHLFAHGYEQIRVQVNTPPWRAVIAAASLAGTADSVLALQRRALPPLALVWAICVLIGVLFLRRAVVQPLVRITKLVGNEDRAGLARFGSDTRSDLAQLSRAIIGMTQRIDEDRDRITAQLAEISATQQQLVRAERLAVVGQLAAGLAHEIGNPLTVIGGFLTVLDDPNLAASERHDALAHVRRELDRIQATVRDLLDFSRAPQLAAGTGELGEAFLYVGKLLAPQERMREVSLEMPVLAAPVHVPIDTGGLTQLFLNLLLNAADAVNGRGRVRVRVESDRDRVRVSVEDSGPGVPAALRERIFEPFFTTKPAGHGTGLGLSVCERLVTAAGGDLTLADSDLGGACFRVTLPVSGDRGR